MIRLNDKTINDFKKQLDYSIADQQERINKVKEVLYDNKGNLDLFFERYFHQDSEAVNTYFKVNLNQEDKLSSENEVCKGLETIANYILYCEGGERINKKTKYNFYTEENFQRQIKKEKIIDLDGDDDVIDFLIRKGTNYKKSNEQKIMAKDFYDPELLCVDEYQKLLLHYKERLDTIRKGEKRNKRLEGMLLGQMKALKDDQILCKDKIKGTIYFKHVLGDSTEIDFDLFDYFDEQQVMALLQMSPRDLTTDLGLLIYDMQQVIKDTPLTPVELEIIHMYSDEKETQETIAQKLQVTQQFVSATLHKICAKIMDTYEGKLEDWYYLNNVKGKYKKCSKCGEIKIANDRYYDKHPNTKDGLYPRCKICR